MKDKTYRCFGGHSGGDAVYGLGLIGAVIYNLSHSNTFMEAVIGVLKAIVWPAYLIYKLAEILNF